MRYRDVGYPQLRVCSDFTAYLFHLNDLFAEKDADVRSTADVVLNSLRNLDEPSSSRIERMTRDVYKRMIPTTSIAIQRRFIQTLELFFEGVVQQRAPAVGVVSDLEAYIDSRRERSASKPMFVLIEYAHNLNIPDNAIAHADIKKLEDAANDFITWSNEIFSYNVERSKCHAHNVVAVVMAKQELSLQEAIDHVGEMCHEAFQKFMEACLRLPTFGENTDRDVKVYVDGLRSCMAAALHWPFETQKYFGKRVAAVKTNRVVEQT
ncbi:isoprenoid synthase domain-containing protein [Mycena rebaudengoi]|nr:isoprenoid synthase domain-containing protein [Mycena rebaudengoi]